MGRVNTRIFLRVKEGGRRCDDRGRIKVIQHEEDLTVHCLLGLKMEGAMNQGTQATSRSWKRQGKRFFSESQERIEPCQHPDFNPVRPVLDY